MVCLFFPCPSALPITQLESRSYFKADMLAQKLIHFVAIASASIGGVVAAPANTVSGSLVYPP